jgi:hypothetical protein
MTNPPFKLTDQDPESVAWPYCAMVMGYPEWVMHNHWTGWVETSGIVVTCVGTSFYFRSREDRMQFVLAWS